MAPENVKQVTFGDLTITDYPIILGDNPCCSGAPITIGWGKFISFVNFFSCFRIRCNLCVIRFFSSRLFYPRLSLILCLSFYLIVTTEPMGTHTRNMELYEYARAQRRQGKKRLTIPVQKRSQMLLDAGFTQEQIIKAALEVAEIKREREETIASLRTTPQLLAFGKLSKNFMSGFNSLKIGVGPKPARTTVSARSA